MTELFILILLVAYRKHAHCGVTSLVTSGLAVGNSFVGKGGKPSLYTFSGMKEGKL